MSVKIVSRAAWGARPWNGTPAVVPLSKRTEFFVHWYGGVPASESGVALAREVERLHIDGNGWAGVGYNFIIGQDGTAYEGRGWDLQGAHCPDHNISGLAVLIAVGKGGKKASDAALATARALYDEACERTGRTLARKGHKDGFATECPGPDLYAWVHAGMPVEDYEPEPKKPAPAKPTCPPFPGRSYFLLGAINKHALQLQTWLDKGNWGPKYKVGPSRTMTQTDLDKVKALQRHYLKDLGPADGLTGPKTWQYAFETANGLRKK